MSRFILIVNIGRVSMKDYSINEDGKVNISLKYKILVYLNSPPAFIVVFIFSYLFFMFPYLVIYFIGKDWARCDDIADVHILIVGFHVLFLSFSSLALLAFDFLYNIKLILKCGWMDYFYKKDPNLFRIEALPAALIAPIMFSVLIPGNAGIIRSIFYFTVYNLYLFYLTSGFVFIVTIVNIIFERFRKSKADDIGYVFALKDPKLREVFMKFAEKEYNTENILIKLDIMEYREHKKISSRKDLALKMKSKYLNGKESTFELNMEETKRLKVWEKIEKQEFDDDLFKEIDETVNSNLLDMFNRFKLTKDYIEYRDIHKIKDQML